MRGRWLVLAVTLGAGPAAAWVPSRTEGGAPLVWGRRCIPFWINERGSEDLGDFAVAEDAVEKSFRAWEDVDCSDLEFPYQGPTDIDLVGRDFRNVVVWRDAPGSWPYDRGVIALTTTTFCTEADDGPCDVVGRILDADIELNGVDYAFTHNADPARTRLDVRNTLTHEVGHLIGLDHSPERDATMYADGEPGQTSKATLHADDVAGVCRTYPAVRSPAACEPIDASETAPRADAGCAAVDGVGGPFAVLALGLLRRRRPVSGGAGRAG
jgi:hypothetical protein